MGVWEYLLSAAFGKWRVLLLEEYGKRRDSVFSL